METDRTGKMLRSSCTCIMDTLGGILALSLFAGGMFVAHEVMLPSGRVMPYGNGEASERVSEGVGGARRYVVTGKVFEGGYRGF